MMAGTAEYTAMHEEAIRESGVLDPQIEWVLKFDKRTPQMKARFPAREPVQIIVTGKHTIHPDALIAALKKLAPTILQRWQESQGRIDPWMRRIADGEDFTFLGEPMKLRITRPGQPVDRVRLSTGWALLVPQHSDPQQMAAGIKSWYIDQGNMWIRQAAEPWLAKMGLDRNPPSFTCRDIGMRRWGLYRPPRHAVELNWQLMQLLPELVESVLLHELAHATRPVGKAHGPAFLRALAAVQPDHRYMKIRTDNAGRLVWDGQIY